MNLKTSLILTIVIFVAVLAALAVAGQYVSSSLQGAVSDSGLGKLSSLWNSLSGKTASS